jgi:hypothetical protein
MTLRGGAGPKDAGDLRDRVTDLLRRWQDLCEPAADPELEAITIAVLVEDVFGVTVPEASLDLRVLGEPQELTDLLTTLTGAA